MGSVTWNDDEDEHLIQFVKIHPCLYDIQCREYHLNDLKTDLWKEIGDILKKQGLECSARWSFIKENYLHCLQLPTSDCDRAIEHRLELMAFLEKDSFQAMHAGIYNNHPEYSYCFVTDPIENAAIKIPTDHLDQSQHNGHQQTEKSFATNGKYFPSTNVDERLKLLKQLQRQHHGRNRIEQKDETDLFFASMAECVKKLPPAERAKLRMQIGTIVGTAEIEHYRNKNDCEHNDAGPTTPLSSSSNFSRSYEDLYTEVKGDLCETVQPKDTVRYLPWSDNN